MRRPLRVRIVRMGAAAVGPYWIPLSARSRRGRLLAVGYRLIGCWPSLTTHDYAVSPIFGQQPRLRSARAGSPRRPHEPGRRAPSFWKMTCSRFLTATSVRPVARPISRLVAPLLARRRISRSSGERSVVRWVCSRARPPNSSSTPSSSSGLSWRRPRAADADGGDQLLRRGALEQVAVGARFQRLAHVGLVAVRGEDDDGNVVI